jgi:hypothetical protein
LIAEMQDCIGHCLRLLTWIGPCVRATLRCCYELIEPEVMEIGPGQANGLA